MTNLVDPSEVESIVGARRHKTSHLCRTVDDIVYILHSQQCIEDYPDLRKCPFSKALDRANKVSGGAACSRLQPGGSERPLSESGATNQTADSVIGSICE